MSKRKTTATITPQSAPKSTRKTRAADLAAARHAGGNQKQSHWMDRLKAVMKGRAKTETKS